MHQISNMNKLTFPKEHHITSICASIINDRHVARWFLELITLPEIRKNKIKNEYDNLFKKIYLQRALGIFSFFYIISIIMLQIYYLLPTCLAPVICTWLIYNEKKQQIQTISHRILKRDFDHNHFEQKTIYQISEFYSQKHHCLSLVDFMTKSDVTLRKTILFTNPNRSITCIISTSQISTSSTKSIWIKSSS